MRSTGIFLFFFAGLMMSCTDSLYIEKSEKILTNDADSLKIICIDPRIYFDSDEENYNLERNEKLLQQFKRHITEFSEKNGIALGLYDLNSKSEPFYYSELLKLKLSMLAVNHNQQTKLNFNNSDSDYNKIQKKIFVYPPKVPHEFSDFSRRYGTPLFSYMSLFIAKKEVKLYLIVINTDLSEIIYREFKIVKNGMRNDILNEAVYESFAMLKRELVKKQ